MQAGLNTSSMIKRIKRLRIIEFEEKCAYEDGGLVMVMRFRVQLKLLDLIIISHVRM